MWQEEKSESQGEKEQDHLHREQTNVKCLDSFGKADFIERLLYTKKL